MNPKNLKNRSRSKSKNQLRADPKEEWKKRCQKCKLFPMKKNINKKRATKETAEFSEDMQSSGIADVVPMTLEKEKMVVGSMLKIIMTEMEMKTERKRDELSRIMQKIAIII